MVKKRKSFSGRACPPCRPLCQHGGQAHPLNIPLMSQGIHMSRINLLLSVLMLTGRSGLPLRFRPKALNRPHVSLHRSQTSFFC